MDDELTVKEFQEKRKASKIHRYRESELRLIIRKISEKLKGDYFLGGTNELKTIAKEQGIGEYKAMKYVSYLIDTEKLQSCFYACYANSQYINSKHVYSFVKLPKKMKFRGIEYRATPRAKSKLNDLFESKARKSYKYTDKLIDKATYVGCYKYLFLEKSDDKNILRKKVIERLKQKGFSRYKCKVSFQDRNLNLNMCEIRSNLWTDDDRCESVELCSDENKSIILNIKKSRIKLRMHELTRHYEDATFN